MLDVKTMMLFPACFKVPLMIAAVGPDTHCPYYIVFYFNYLCIGIYLPTRLVANNSGQLFFYYNNSVLRRDPHPHFL